MNILVLGNDGYIGHALTLRLLAQGHSVTGGDDFSRRVNVYKMGSHSATRIHDTTTRVVTYDKYGLYRGKSIDISRNYYRLVRIIEEDGIDTVVNLAQQPSAPFSHASRETAEDTTTNNLIGTLNILHAIRDTNPNIHLIQIGSMGEYDHTIGVDIEEGEFQFEHKGKVSKPSIFPRRPGSWYHASKVAATYYIDCACRWWGLRATDIMQGVVYGAWTPEIEETGSYTRLDTDEAFGTVVHRFVVQSLIGKPMTVYGHGNHSRGFLALNDSIQCLELAINNKPDKGVYNTWNQLDTTHSINDIADMVGGRVRNVKTPRGEITGAHYYNPITDKLKDLGFQPTRTMEEEIQYMKSILDLVYISDLAPEPEIKW